MQKYTFPRFLREECPRIFSLEMAIVNFLYTTIKNLYTLYFTKNRNLLNVKQLQIWHGNCYGKMRKKYEPIKS